MTARRVSGNPIAQREVVAAPSSAPSSAPVTGGWECVLLLPVKASVDAKSRLGLGRPDRLVLRRAFAQDALAAARAARLMKVCVVGDGTGLDAALLPDEGDGDLNVALQRAADRVVAPHVGVAVLLPDVPCLTSADLIAALHAARELGRRCFVADAHDSGTTLLVAPPGARLDPHFGPDSAARHRASGAHEIDAALPTLRRDVDTPEDLLAAVELGVGPHTRGVLEDVGFGVGRRSHTRG